MAHAQSGVSEGRREGADRLSGRFFGACGGISCKGHEELPEPGDLTLEIGSRPGVVDDHVGGGEPMVAGGLRGDPGMAGGLVETVAGTDPGELCRLVRVDHDDEVEAVRLTSFDEQGDDVDDHSAGRCRGLQLGRTTPHSRVDERLEVLPHGGVGEDDAAERRTVQ